MSVRPKHRGKHHHDWPNQIQPIQQTCGLPRSRPLRRCRSHAASCSLTRRSSPAAPNPGRVEAREVVMAGEERPTGNGRWGSRGAEPPLSCQSSARIPHSIRGGTYSGIQSGLYKFISLILEPSITTPVSMKPCADLGGQQALIRSQSSSRLACSLHGWLRQLDGHDFPSLQ